jgi:hypothetical protein
MLFEPVGDTLLWWTEISDKILSSFFPTEQKNTKWKTWHTKKILY